MVEDRLLLWRFKNGSEDALCRIYEKYRNTLLKLAVALINDTIAAEDIVQDVFVSFAQAGSPGLHIQEMGKDPEARVVLQVSGRALSLTTPARKTTELRPVGLAESTKVHE